MTNSTNDTKKDTARKLINVFFMACKLGFPALGLALVVALVVPLLVGEPATKTLTAKLTFTGVGLLFGILQVFLGVLLALVGVTIDYDVDASVGPARLKLASASPGILLLLVGNFLFAFSLMRQFEVTQLKAETQRAPATADGGAASDATGRHFSVPPLKGADGPE